MGTCARRNSRKRTGSHASLKNNGNPRPKTPDNRLETTEVSLNSRKTEADSGRMERTLWKRLGRNIYKKLDGALPQKHTLKLYNSLSTTESAILIQLRTDHNHLQKYLYRRKLTESPQCECGQNEDSTRHLLLECSKWEAERRLLRPKVGARWGDLSYMLGGWNSWKDRRGNTMDGPKEKWEHK